MNSNAFDTFAINDTKYQIRIQNFTLLNESDAESSHSSDLLACKEVKFAVKEPHIAIWDYLPKEAVTELLELKSKTQTRTFIEDKLENQPKGIPKIIVRELMYTVTKFCKSATFNLEQTGAVLSQFYLTHVFFTSHLSVGAEKLYEYFKELQLCHSLPFPPQSIKLFSLEQIKSIMVLFCRLYLRNLPIIRFMSLPNFTLKVNYHLEPDPILGKKKKGKKKKGKKKGEKKEKKGKGKKKKK